MTEERSIDVSLRIVVGADPISGSLDDGAGNMRPYVGWIELMDAVEAARSSASDTGSTDTAERATGSRE